MLWQNPAPKIWKVWKCKWKMVWKQKKKNLQKMSQIEIAILQPSLLLEAVICGLKKDIMNQKVITIKISKNSDQIKCKCPPISLNEILFWQLQFNSAADILCYSIIIRNFTVGGYQINYSSLDKLTSNKLLPKLFSVLFHVQLSRTPKDPFIRLR